MQCLIRSALSKMSYIYTCYFSIHSIIGYILFYSSWWPMFVLIFYATSPIPSMIARRYADSVEASNALIEVCIFITTGIVVSAFGLPIILAHLAVVRNDLIVTIWFPKICSRDMAMVMRLCSFSFLKSCSYDLQTTLLLSQVHSHHTNYRRFGILMFLSIIAIQ